MVTKTMTWKYTNCAISFRVKEFTNRLPGIRILYVSEACLYV